MGTTQSSPRPSYGLALGDKDQELLAEFIDHSRTTIDECAAIFRGVNAALDDDSGGIDGPGSERWAQEKRQRAVPYPRRLPPAQFDEVFGMLVADAERHFAFFRVSGASPVTIAHEVFCCIALLMRADLRAKTEFVLSLYADSAGRLSPDAKRSLVTDMAAAVARLTGATESVPSALLAHIEKIFFVDDSDKLSTVRELFDACFTDARLSGVLHELHSRVHEFVAAQRRQRVLRTAVWSLSGGPCSDFRVQQKPSLSPKRSSLKMLAATRARSVLWAMRTGDFPALWKKLPPRVLRAEATTFASALASMARDRACIVIVESKDYPTAALTTDHFLAYYLYTLRQLESDVASAAIQREQQLQRQAQTERTVRAVADVRLSEVLSVVSAELERLSDRSFFSRLCVDEDLPLFHAVLPLASGRRAVAVLPTALSQLLPHDGQDSESGTVLGALDALDMLQWMERDLSVLNGKHLLPVSALPELFYAPATASAASLTVSDALAEMAARQVSGIVTLDLKLLSADTFRDAYVATLAQLTGALGAISPPPLLLTSRLEPATPVKAASAGLLPRCQSVPPTESLANVIRAMVKHRARRALIQRPADGAAVGAVRATDILALLLQEQHTVIE